MKSTNLLAAALIALAFAVPAAAHEAECPVCKLPVVQDTATQDNEVPLRYGRKRIEYRCVQCALTDAKNGTYKNGDITILAPSEVKGRPIPIARTAGKWSAPAGTVFVGVDAGHNVCPVTFRAFSSKAAFDAYVKKNAATVPALKDAKPLTRDQLVAK